MALLEVVYRVLSYVLFNFRSFKTYILKIYIQTEKGGIVSTISFWNKIDFEYHFSQKEDGNMKVTAEEGKANREIYLKKIGLTEKDKLVMAKVFHSNGVVIIDRSFCPEIVLDVDGLVTRLNDTYLGVTFADCLPVLFYEGLHGVIGIAHCGWRGIQKEVTLEVIKSMEYLDAQREEILVIIGPGIEQVHYEFGLEAEEIFEEYIKIDPLLIKYNASKTKVYLDLKEILKLQLVKKGNLFPYHIKNIRECTFCNPQYFSARRDKTDPVKAGMALIGKRTIFK